LELSGSNTISVNGKLIKVFSFSLFCEWGMLEEQPL